MDGDNQNNIKTEDCLKKAKNKGNDSRKEVIEEFPEKKHQNNSLKKYKSKTKSVTNEIKINAKETTPEKKGNDSKNKPQENGSEVNCNKSGSENTKDFKNSTVVDKSQEKMTPKKVNKFKKQKKEISQKENSKSTDGLIGETFELDDIINNPRALELVEDLVSCFTCNSTLPENELQTLKISLIERTCSVLLSVLNNCMNKTLTKVLNTDIFQEFQKVPILKKDAGCQTCSCLSEGKGIAS